MVVYFLGADGYRSVSRDLWAITRFGRSPSARRKQTDSVFEEPRGSPWRLRAPCFKRYALPQSPGAER